MKFTAASVAAFVACTAAVNAAPAAVGASSNTLLLKREDADRLQSLMDDLDTYKAKRDTIDQALTKREYEIVTQVLSLLNDTGVAPDVIHYLATDPTLQPYVINTIVTVAKSGLLDVNTLLSALNESGLVTNTIQLLISDCGLYVQIFNLAKAAIADLIPKVEGLIESGVLQLLSREDVEELGLVTRMTADSGAELVERDLNDVVVNLLESLSNSGLATSVVKSIITDSSYIPFAVNLIKAVLQNNALDLGSLLSALKLSGLVDSLITKFLNFGTLETIFENAFAAFSGKCAAAASGGSGAASGGSTGGSSGGSAAATIPAGTSKTDCKKRRRRKRSYNY
jgi:hypothetical protein